MLRFKVYTLIKIFGLSIGLSCCILITLYLKEELSYDRFHEKSDRIYRIVTKYSYEGKTKYYDRTPAPLAPAILQEYQGPLIVTRLGRGNGDVIKYGDVQTRSNIFELADPNIFDVFTLPFVRGNPQSALNDLHSLIISESLSRKYFGDENPLGKTIQIGKDNRFHDFKVTGVFKDLPSNSYLKFDCLASFQNMNVRGNEGNLTWGAWNYETFILLPGKYSSVDLERRLTQIFEKNNTLSAGEITELFLQPLTSIHLSLDPGNKFPTEGDNESIFIFTGVALFILIIACMNFINLATAHASVRENEVGVRKVVGANRLQLANQFISESILLSILAFLMSIPIVELLLPIFNQYSEKRLLLFSVDNIYFLILLPGIAVIVGILAGCYPALFISSFKPISILQGRLSSGKTNDNFGLKRIFVTFQFVISILFAVCALTMHSQLHYIKGKNLGYDKEHLVVLPLYNQDVLSKVELFKSEVLRNPAVRGATAASFLPSGQSYRQNVYFRGPAEGAMKYMSWISVDPDFITTMGLNLTTGENFSRDYPTATGVKYILNESAVKQIGWKNPLSEEMNIIGWGPIIGVMRDFHFKSLHHIIEPVALCIYPPAFRYLFVRISPENIAGTIHFLENRWKDLIPNYTFEYSFFDEDFDKLYKNEIRLENVFNFITVLSLLVACLGIFGLVRYTAERRTKELGIRKVLGSTVVQILMLLTKDFIKWIAIANIIAWPFAYYIMSKWLQDYAYRVELTIWPFLLSGILVMFIALLTVSWQAIKAATANPVEALRYE